MTMSNTEALENALEMSVEAFYEKASALIRQLPTTEVFEFLIVSVSVRDIEVFQD